MNDAGFDDRHAETTPPLVAWFHGQARTPDDRPLPLLPFVRCAGESAARLGALDLQAAIVLLPAQALGAWNEPNCDRTRALLSAEWFAHCDPQQATRAVITLDSGQVSSISSAADQISGQIAESDQRAFICESYSVVDDASSPITPPIHDRFWNGPALHQASFTGTLAEWSFDSLGWLANFLADISAWQGIRTPLLLTITRV